MTPMLYSSRKPTNNGTGNTDCIGRRFLCVDAFFDCICRQTVSLSKIILTLINYDTI